MAAPVVAMRLSIVPVGAASTSSGSAGFGKRDHVTVPLAPRQHASRVRSQVPGTVFPVQLGGCAYRARSRRSFVMMQSHSTGTEHGGWAESSTELGQEEPNKNEGPMRFLKFAVGAGAAAAALGAATWAANKKRQSAADKADIEEAIAAGAPPAAAAAGLGPGGSQSYTVQKGDTLASIASKLGTSEAVLREANDLRDDRLNPGQKLWTPKTYTIQEGDGLYKIAREFNVNFQDLVALNSIKNPDLIYEGDVILIP